MKVEVAPGEQCAGESEWHRKNRMLEFDHVECAADTLEEAKRSSLRKRKCFCLSHAANQLPF